MYNLLNKDITMKNLRLITWILLSSILIGALAGCQTTATQPLLVATATTNPPTVTPKIPTLTPTPEIIPATGEPIKIQSLSIVIKYNGFIDIGYNPMGLPSNMAMQFDISEESGKIDELVALGMSIIDNQGNRVETAFIETGTNYKGVKTLTWNILTTDPKGKYYIKFPTGEIVDLTPLIK
jgi:hypothetical protein